MPENFDRMVDAIKRNLKKRYPSRSEEDISSSAYAIATKNWKDQYNKNP